MEINGDSIFGRTALLLGAEAVNAFARLRVAVFGVGGVGGGVGSSLLSLPPPQAVRLPRTSRPPSSKLIIFIFFIVVYLLITFLPLMMLIPFVGVESWRQFRS